LFTQIHTNGFHSVLWVVSLVFISTGSGVLRLSSCGMWCHAICGWVPTLWRNVWNKLHNITSQKAVFTQSCCHLIIKYEGQLTS